MVGRRARSVRGRRDAADGAGAAARADRAPLTSRSWRRRGRRWRRWWRRARPPSRSWTPPRCARRPATASTRSHRRPHGRPAREFRADDADALAAQVERGGGLRRFRLLAPAAFTTRPRGARPALAPAQGPVPVGGEHAALGTAVVIEDVWCRWSAWPRPSPTCQVLYADTTSRTPSPSATRATATCTSCSRKDFADPPPCAATRLHARARPIVVGKYDGALKAEHGSGRNMAPFVRDEWGDRAYGVMRGSRPARPRRHPEPGRRPERRPRGPPQGPEGAAHISPTADKCIECGFCEPRCPRAT
jgi:D-lactate dehydrogenase